MSFLPGLGDAVSKAYTALDDVVEAVSKGHDLVSILRDLIEAVGMVFHHTGIRPSEASPVPLGTGDSEQLRPTSDPLALFAPPAQMLSAPTRDDRILRDLQP